MSIVVQCISKQLLKVIWDISSFFRRRKGTAHQYACEVVSLVHRPCSIPDERKCDFFLNNLGSCAQELNILMLLLGLRNSKKWLFFKYCRLLFNLISRVPRPLEVKVLLSRLAIEVWEAGLLS